MVSLLVVSALGDPSVRSKVREWCSVGFACFLALWVQGNVWVELRDKGVTSYEITRCILESEIETILVDVGLGSEAPFRIEQKLLLEAGQWSGRVSAFDISKFDRVNGEALIVVDRVTEVYREGDVVVMCELPRVTILKVTSRP